MNAGTTAGLLQLISAAVTPVVLISACAALILGVNTKHTGIADRLRIFTAEQRNKQTDPVRLVQVESQITVFFQRFRLTWMSLASLYSAIFAFILMVLTILLAQQHATRNPVGALAMFIVGIALMLAAVIFEIMEVALSIRCMEIELRDAVTPEKHASGRRDG